MFVDTKLINFQNKTDDFMKVINKFSIRVYKSSRLIKISSYIYNKMN